MTGITRKSYRIWMTILDHPNEWQDMTTIGKRTDMTARQASTVLSHIHDPRLMKENAMVMFSGTKEEAEMVRREVTRACFDISEEAIRRVHDLLSDVGAVTLTDISLETGYARSDVARILKMMDDVHAVPDRTQTLYYVDNA